MTGVALPTIFGELIKQNDEAQKALLNEVNELSKDPSSITPGKMMLLQMKYGWMNQIGDSTSNLIAISNAMINNCIRNQK